MIPFTQSDLAHPAFILRTGERWHRIMTALLVRPYTEGDLFRATDPRKHSRKVERARVHRAVRAMAHHGLIRSIPGWGWTLTTKGREALAEVTEAKPTTQLQRAA